MRNRRGASTDQGLTSEIPWETVYAVRRLGLGEQDSRRDCHRRSRSRPGSLGVEPHRAGVDLDAGSFNASWRSRRPAGDHRSDQWADRRPLAGRRTSGGASASDRVSCRAAAMGSLRRQIRSRRQLQTRRLPAHGRTPAAQARPGRCRSARTAGTHPAPRRPSSGPHRRDQPARISARQLLARPQKPLIFAGLAHRAGLPHRLPHTPIGREARRGPHGRVPTRELLPRRKTRRTAAGPVTRRCRSGRPTAHRHPGTDDRNPSPVAARHPNRHCRAGKPDQPTRRSAPPSPTAGRAPGVGTINLAQLLAEIGPILDRVDTVDQAGAECGVTPVTKASGKTSGVYFRWAANTRARKAITAFAHNARMQSPWAAKLYSNARARGKRNPHATRIVARAWLRVIWACWHHRTPYDPAIHHAAQRLTG